MTDKVRTDHTARLRFGHGEDCEGCQNLAVEKAAHIVSLAGWRIVRTDGGLPAGVPNRTVVYVTEEWKP